MKTKPFLKSMALVICCLTSFVLVSCDKDDDKPSSGYTTDADNNKDNDQDSKGDDSDVKEEPLKAGKITISGSKNIGDKITLTSSATGGDENYKYKYTIKRSEMELLVKNSKD